MAVPLLVISLVGLWIAAGIAPADLGTNVMGVSEGTDHLGRPIVFRVALATLHSVSRASISACAMAILVIAIVAWTRDAKLRSFRAFEASIASIPLLLPVAAMASVAGNGATWLTLLAPLLIFGWAHHSIPLRANVERLSRLEYVEAARALGASDLRLFLHHLLPNSGELAGLVLRLFAEYLVLFGALSIFGLAVGDEVDLGFVCLEYTQTEASLAVYPLATYSLLLLVSSWLGETAAAWSPSSEHRS